MTRYQLFGEHNYTVALVPACAWLAATGAVLELDDSLDVDADDDEVELDDLEGALAFDDDCLVLTLIPTSA